MPEYRTEPLIVPYVSGLLPEGERNRRVALTSFSNRHETHRVPMRDIICYECGRSSQVPAAALSANCIHCHAHLNMADVELRCGSTRCTVSTLGDITLLSDAVLSHLSLTCRDLHVLGKGVGAVRCSRKMTVQGSFRQVGKFRVRELEVCRGSELRFETPVELGQASINGLVVGDITAEGDVRIRRHGILRGHCHAARLIIEPGGRQEDAPEPRSAPGPRPF